MRRRPERQVAAEQHRSPTHNSSREISSRNPEAIRIELLGGFRLRVGSRIIEDNQWRLKKAKSLVKLLALSPAHRLHREQVMEILWPGLEPHAATNNLHYALHVARRVLESSASASTSTSTSSAASASYLLLRDEHLNLCPDSPVWVDANAFEEAAATARYAPVESGAFRVATDLYAGELLPEDRYEPWVEERRAQLRELYLSLLLELAALLEKREEFEEAIEALGRVVAQVATHEVAHVELMRLYALSGKRRQALSQYERLREVLFREFGSEPEAATTRLQQEIWAGTFPHPDSPPAALPAEEDIPSGAEPAEAVASRRHNLPLARTSFVGRGREMLVVKRLLAMTKLLTLTGTGGCGKTRLALEVAKDLVGAYPEGVWLIELAPLSDPSLVEQAVAQALGVREQSGRPLLETLSDTLRSKKMLLVMDNCEHLIDAVARLVDALLGSCPDLRILATSRERLSTSGEINRVVPSLTVPHDLEPSTPRRLEAYESVRLFVERAQQRDPSFVLSASNAQAVSQVCQRLDGIPLAIELAAARIGVLSVGQLAKRLEDSLKVLTRGERTAEPRHQSLRATLEWSHDLLSKPERMLFRRLAVFAGGWTLEAAEEVCSGEGQERDEVLDVLSELVERSLVVAEAGQEEVPRFRMLEPIRQYGQELLDESGELEALRSRHAEYYLTFAQEADVEREGGQEEADPRMQGAPPVAWLRQMEAEHANLRAALSWALDEDAEQSDGDTEPYDRRVELGLRLAVALFWFWYTRDYSTEGRSYLERARSSGSRTTAVRLRARALNGAGGLAVTQGDYEAAKVLIEEGLALYRELGDEEGIGSALTDLGLIALWGQRDDIPVGALMEELGELKPRIENRRMHAWMLVLEGMIVGSQGDLERCRTLHEESLEIFRELRDTGAIINTLAQLGAIELAGGDYERAVPVLRETLRLGWETDYAVPIQSSLFLLACVAASQEQPVRAARLWGAVEGMEESYGVHVSPMALSSFNYEGRLAAAHSQLDEEAWSAAWTQGKAMPLEQAVEYALSEDEEEHESPTLVAVPEQEQPLPAVDQPPTETLTAREQEIALLVARGLTNRQIAKELSISERTAANHVARILKKLGLHSRAQIATWATQRRLLPSEPSY